MARRYKILLARLVRQQVTVVVEAPDWMAKADIKSAAYEQYDDADWEDDDIWGCEQGTHTILETTTDEPDIVLTDDDGEEETDGG